MPVVIFHINHQQRSLQAGSHVLGPVYIGGEEPQIGEVICGGLPHHVNVIKLK